MAPGGVVLDGNGCVEGRLSPTPVRSCGALCRESSDCTHFAVYARGKRKGRCCPKVLTTSQRSAGWYNWTTDGLPWACPKNGRVLRHFRAQLADIFMTVLHAKCHGDDTRTIS